jgi:UDP-N-acetylglucosamine 2-epimerase (non-hydrolysing)
MDNNISKIMCVVGARPNFMKIAPIIDAIKQWNNDTSVGKKKELRHILVHTGQHYDAAMSKQFFDELSIPRPDVNLEVGSLSHAEQTAEIMKRFEPVLMKEQPDCVVVVGDVNSTVACALVCSKIQYPAARRVRPLVVHVEAGLRSYDRDMPEEVNRVLTDAISDVLFTTEESAADNLKREGISGHKIYFVGNVMIDTLQRHRKNAEQSAILGKLGLSNPSPVEKAAEEHGRVKNKEPYAILTLHRPSNVDDKKTFSDILDAVLSLDDHFRIIYPIHPRSLGKIKSFQLGSSFDWRYYDAAEMVPETSHHDNRPILAIPPLGYIDFLHLMANADLVLTDSGGIQEETTILGVPCVTLRENTERPITVTHGTNIIAGTQKDKIIKAALRQLQNARKNPAPPLWDGRAARRIVEKLVDLV